VRDSWSGARWAAFAFAAVLLAVEGVIVAESWRGLTGFAHLIGITGPWAWGVPVTLDGVSLVAALVALRAELAGESSGIYRATLFLFTAASAAANWWHGYHQGGTNGALYLGGMSLAVAWVFALSLRQIRHEDRRRAGRVTDQLPRFSAAHWLRFPGLTFAAWSLAIRDGHKTAREALAAAVAAVDGQAADADQLPDVPADDELAAMSKADAIRLALAHNDGNVIMAQQWLAARGISVDRAYCHDVKMGRSGRGRRARRQPLALVDARGGGAA
jgi:Protein of unknown function (DUF2637)